MIDDSALFQLPIINNFSATWFDLIHIARHQMWIIIIIIIIQFTLWFPNVLFRTLCEWIEQLSFPWDLHNESLEGQKSDVNAREIFHFLNYHLFVSNHWEWGREERSPIWNYRNKNYSFKYISNIIYHFRLRN